MGDGDDRGLAPEPVAIDTEELLGELFEMTPTETVKKLDEYIIGQGDAKRAIAIALRNRWRRMQVPEDLRDEISPKNILMVGPTGVGKTEIARRLAKLVNAPFVKVEATKFTEVGFHGRDVDTIIKDLCEASLVLVKEMRRKKLEAIVEPIVREKLVTALTGAGASASTRKDIESLLDDGLMEDRAIDIELPASAKDSNTMQVDAPGGMSFMIDASELLGRLNGPRQQRMQIRRLKVSEARPQLMEAEMSARLANADLRKEAKQLAEQHGIVVIDEIDKIVAGKSRYRASGDASDEGVQRDLLPLIEGTSVEVMRFGQVNTDFILFVASGAFHEAKPADMLAELQGRLPIRVELKGLNAESLLRILTEPVANLIVQHKALMKAEGVELVFEQEALVELANLAEEINRTVENIGARRLYTVLERVLESHSFAAAEMEEGTVITITAADVRSKLEDVLKVKDLKKFIL